jgi:hypothetical protein
VPSELERRLERALRGMPDSSRDARERARRAALDALPPSPRRAPRTGGLGLVAAAVALVLAAGGGALAASGTIELTGGPEPANRPDPPPPRPARPARVLLPERSAGFAIVVGGRVWVRTASGRGLAGAPLDTPTISPGALYAIGGRGRALVAIDVAGGRVAWRHATRGRIVAAAWSPYPIRVAYIVRTARGHRLQTIWGNGLVPRTRDRTVAPVAPAWRADSVALAYVDAGGAVVVQDVIPPYRRALVRLPAACRGRVGALAFSPAGATLAAATDRGVALLRAGRPASCVPAAATGRVHALRWVDGDTLVAVAGPARRRIVAIAVSPARAAVRAVSFAPARVQDVAVAPGRERLAVALGGDAPARVWIVEVPRRGRDALAARELVRMPADAGAGRIALAWR